MIAEKYNFSDFEVQMLLIERNTCQAKIEAIDELLDKIGQAKGLQDSRKAGSAHKQDAELQEIAFNALKWQIQEGTKIGTFELAVKQDNDQAKFSTAYDELRKADCNIRDRYQGLNYVYTYWLFGEDKIYRQKKK